MDFLAAGGRVDSGREHRVDRIEAIAPKTALRAAAVKVEGHSENTFPLRMRRAALMMSCGEILLSVPASSSAPQRPQFFKRSAAD